jgi:hypothetical protein
VNYVRLLRERSSILVVVPQHVALYSESPHSLERLPNAPSHNAHQTKSLPCGEQPVTGKTVEHVLLHCPKHVTSRQKHTITANGRPQGLSRLLTIPKSRPGMLSRFPRQGPSEATTSYNYNYTTQGMISASEQDTTRPVSLHHWRHGVELHMGSLSTDTRYLLGVGRHGP